MISQLVPHATHHKKCHLHLRGKVMISVALTTPPSRPGPRHGKHYVLTLNAAVADHGTQGSNKNSAGSPHPEPPAAVMATTVAPATCMQEQYRENWMADLLFGA